MIQKKERPLIIFEIANNHMGNLSHAKKIINQYFLLSKPYKSKMDFAFKFQFRDLKTYIHSTYQNTKHSQVERFTSTQFSNNQWDNLIKYTKTKFKIICTPFDEVSVDKIISKKFDYLKIASCSADEWPLLEYIAKKNKNIPMIASLGGASESSIRNIISFFANRKKNIKYLYCVARYPTDPKDLNLSFFANLRSVYGNKIYGFSSHEHPDEILSGSLAYAMGARIFEKHVNISSKKYLINKYSTNEKQILRWLENLSLTIDRVGSVKQRQKFLLKELENLSVFKRGIYIKKNIDLKKGEIIKAKHIEFAFPSKNGQLLSNDFSKFKTFTARINLNGNCPLLKKNILINSQRKYIEEIRDKIHTLINKSGVVVSKRQRIEISHHKGVENFYKTGLCMITIYNSKYCKKLLFLMKNQFHPPQYHKIKQETFFILFGKVKVEIKKSKRSFNKILKTGDLVTIFPGEIHSFKGVSAEGCVIEELSTKSNKNDSFYLDKSISQNKDRKSFISL